jgi:ribosomal protein L35AE/L33A
LSAGRNTFADSNRFAVSIRFTNGLPARLVGWS